MGRAVCLLACLGLAACDMVGGGSGGGDVSMADGTNAEDWPSYGRTYGEQHYSPLDQINADTIGNLGLAWSLDLPVGNTTTQPIVVDGVIYFARSYSVINAVDAVTGELLWEYDSKSLESNDAKNKPIASWGSRGIAWWNGKVFTLTIDGRLIAVDAETGEPVWESEVPPDESDISHFTVAPRVFDGVVIVGNSGDNGKMRGYAAAYDAESGKELWRFWVVPGNPADGFERPELEMAAKTWSGEWWKYGGNGAPWNAFTYDPETQTVFIGTGNGFPFNHRLRSAGEGDNLFLSSVVALDLKSGKYKWH